MQTSYGAVDSVGPRRSNVQVDPPYFRMKELFIRGRPGTLVCVLGIVFCLVVLAGSVGRTKTEQSAVLGGVGDPEYFEAITPKHHERYEIDPSAPVRRDDFIHLRIHLTHDADMIKHLAERTIRAATPTEETYGQHLTGEEMRRMLSPPQSAVQRIMDWLADHGVEVRPRVAKGSDANGAPEDPEAVGSYSPGGDGGKSDGDRQSQDPGLLSKTRQRNDGSGAYGGTQGIVDRASSAWNDIADTAQGRWNDVHEAVLSPFGDVIRARMTIGQAERLLGTQFRYYVARDKTLRKRMNPVLRVVQGYSVPEHLEGLIDTITPTVHFPKPKKRRCVCCDTSSCECCRGAHSRGSDWQDWIDSSWKDYIANWHQEDVDRVKDDANKTISDWRQWMDGAGPASAAHKGVEAATDGLDEGVRAWVADIIRKYAGGGAEANGTAASGAMPGQRRATAESAGTIVSSSEATATLNPWINRAPGNAAVANTDTSPARQSDAADEYDQGSMAEQPLPEGGVAADGTKRAKRSAITAEESTDSASSVDVASMATHHHHHHHHEQQQQPQLQQQEQQQHSRRRLRRTGVRESPAVTDLAQWACAFNDSPDLVTPPVLKRLYNVNYKARLPLEKNLQATANFGDESFSTEDLALFFLAFSGRGAEGAADALRAIETVGENHPEMPTEEATADVQYIMGMTDGKIRTAYWRATSGDPMQDEDEPYLAFLGDLLALSDDERPKVVSISYGDDEDAISDRYAERVNRELMKLAALGTSIVVASGDGGVQGGHPEACGKFRAVFPASSPWVTSVGGTTALSGEAAVGWGGSGFSSRFDRPSYQSDAVEAFLQESAMANELPSVERFNHRGRAYPDVAAFSTGYVIVAGLGLPAMPFGGTSASAPTIAGLVSLLNDYRMSTGKPSLGLLNPLIYEAKRKDLGGFRDIKKGCMPGCGTEGFKARAGWDPASGVGVPDFQRLLDLVGA